MKLDLPKEWQYSTEMEIRVSDINYGNHMGNERFLAFAHEARIRFLENYGLTELDFGGAALIQADAAITYKGEGHLGDVVQIELAAQQTGNSSFNVFYKFTNRSKGRLMAELRTAIICFDYEIGKAIKIPETAVNSGIFR